MEILEEPQVYAKNGTTYHVLAKEDILPRLNEGQNQDEKVNSAVRVIGYVSLEPITIARYDEDDKHPYMYHEGMKVQGVISDAPVYNKTVSPRGFMGSRRPFYDLRINLARRRATRRVNKMLSN